MPLKVNLTLSSFICLILTRTPHTDTAYSLLYCLFGCRHQVTLPNTNEAELFCSSELDIVLCRLESQRDDWWMIILLRWWMEEIVVFYRKKNPRRQTTRPDRSGTHSQVSLSLYRCVKTKDKKERETWGCLTITLFIFISWVLLVNQYGRSSVSRKVIVVLIRVITKIKSTIY